jgi:succinate dehydrogenase hydrophobic anchor subunit
MGLRLWSKFLLLLRFLAVCGHSFAGVWLLITTTLEKVTTKDLCWRY